MKPEGAADSDRHSISFKKALGWSYVMQGGQYAITTIVTFVVAGIVGPEVFGLVAMAMVYLAFFQLLVRQGMVPALVQKRSLGQDHINSAFWLVIASGVVLTISSFALSNWWAGVNRTPELAPVIRALSVVIILQSLVVVQEALLNRAMDFRSLALRTNAAALLGGGVGLTLALSGFGVWALVAQQIVKACVDVTVLWGLSDWRPRLEASWSAARELMRFSASTTVAGFGSFMNARGDALLIGLFFGPTAVGLYRLALRVVRMVVEVTVRAFHSVSLPELSRLQDDSRRFANRIASMLNSTALIAFPGLGMLAGASSVLVTVIGEAWVPAAPALSVLSLVGSVLVLSLFVGPVVMAIGRPHVFAVVTWTSAVFSAISFVLPGILLTAAPIEEQVLGVALARLALVATSGAGLAMWVLLKYSDNTVRSIAKAVAPGAVTAGFAFVATRLLSAIPWTGAPLLHLVMVVAPSLVMVAVLLWMLEPKARYVFMRTTQMIRGS